MSIERAYHKINTFTNRFISRQACLSGAFVYTAVYYYFLQPLKYFLALPIKA